MFKDQKNRYPVHILQQIPVVNIFISIIIINFFRGLLD
jgi:hypothetical protein